MTQKRCPFHYRGLECKSRNSRDAWSNGQIWSWSTEWSRAKANTVMPRECTGHSKHSLPTTQDSTHGHHQMVNSKIWLYSLHPWHTPLPIWKQSVFPNPVQTLDFWFAYRFHRRVRWSGIPISLRIFQFVVIYTVKGFSIVNEAEVHVFLEFSCFFYDPMDVGNLMSGSSAFSQSSLYI